MRDRTRGSRLGVRWLGVLVAIAAPLAIYVTPAAAQEDGVGTASARGSDPEAELGILGVAASYSAITNCDEAQSTRPFYVRWTEPGGTFSHLFKKDAGAATTSTCVTENGANTNAGTATGLVNGFTPATVSWFFSDSPDQVGITVDPDTGPSLHTGALQPLNGTPGGVWVFGDLPWPALGALSCITPTTDVPNPPDDTEDQTNNQYDFGVVPIGSGGVTTTVTCTATGGAVTLTDITLAQTPYDPDDDGPLPPDVDAFATAPGSTDPCSANLELTASASCTITVSFNPDYFSPADAYQATLFVNHNGTNGPQDDTFFEGTGDIIIP